MPLFSFPQNASQKLKELYQNFQKNDEEYPNAYKFYQNAIKLPVWVNPKDQEIIEKYIKGFQKVAFYIQNQPEIFNSF